MKINSNILKDFHLTKNGNLVKDGALYIIIDKCETCEDPYLMRKYKFTKFCSRLCCQLGKNNPNWKNGLMDNRQVYFNIKTSEYVAKKKDQTPILTELENEKILMYYKIRGYLGKGWHVDHIIPLSKGGLHHPENLQILTKAANHQKYNKITNKYKGFRI